VKRLIARLLVPLLGLVGIVTLTPAAAHASYSDCTTGYVCLWQNDGGSGFPSLVVQQAGGTCYNVPTYWNDKMNSFSNRLLYGKHVQFYKDANCTGHLLHRQLDRTNGPFGSNPIVQDNFLSIRNHGDRDIFTSIFFNTG
jgi:hypothetical protein